LASCCCAAKPLGSLNTYVDGEKVTSMSPNGIGAFSGKTIWFGTVVLQINRELKRLVITIQAYWMSLHFGIALGTKENDQWLVERFMRRW
jgi:hypothetical protein